LHFLREEDSAKKCNLVAGSSVPPDATEKSKQVVQEDCMTHLAVALFGNQEIFGNFGMWAFLACGAVALFGILVPTVTWLDSRRKEREAFYKAETFRRLSEASTDGAKAAIEMLREESRLERQKRREGMKLGGLICVAVGAAMVIFLRVQSFRDPDAPYLVGLIPVFVGVALLVYVYFMSAPVE
jgi:hypothetical protein